MTIKSSLKLRSVFFAALVRTLAVTILVALSTTLCLATKAPEPQASPSVVFLNPGEPVDRGKGMFWPMTARLMAVAAKTFGMRLEVLYAERDHLLILRQAESVSQLKNCKRYIERVVLKVLDLLTLAGKGLFFEPPEEQLPITNTR